MEKRELIYEGKAKRVYATDQPGQVIHEFKDEATAFDGKKRGVIAGKGKVNARMSDIIFRYLEKHGIHTHHIKLLSDNQILTWWLEMIPVEIIVRNFAAGSLAKRLGYPERTEMKAPIVEYYYKNDELGDPMLTREHIHELGLAGDEQLDEMTSIALRVNEILRPYFEARGLILADFKLEFGTREGRLLLGDEFSPDVCRLWDAETGEIMDKDRFRKDLGRVEETYAEVLRRISEEKTGIAAAVYVSPKKGILDPAGQAALGALKSLGYDEVKDVRIGKYITLRLEGVDEGKAEERVREMCERLLANPIIEDYRVEIE
ncbi:MAG: phosphoribosylaminoimidazolesuccinocarboxamide synthase [Actinomycetota bacterium]|nr:phosphoribosylaminoimidazolesuccinocarboxamide synthase [Actinomycetota bacterium]MDI7251038.1 phosphoribosylaminoimidazolesuccinocarboxamide synthase [Actinomycetota bacterium]